LIRFFGIFAAIMMAAGAGTWSAHAAVTVKPVNVGGGLTTSTGNTATPTRAPGAARLGSGTTVAGGTSVSRAASAPRTNTISKYLQSTAGTLKPGSVIKVPGTGGGGDFNIDLSNYYTIPQTDALLDLKQDLLIPGECIVINGSEVSVDSACVVGGGTGTCDTCEQGEQGEPGREIEMRATIDFIQWKYVDESSSAWRNLIAISQLKGADGLDGTNGLDGADGADGVNLPPIPPECNIGGVNYCYLYVDPVPVTPKTEDMEWRLMV